ncbi:MAG: hypothetical protein AB7T31_11230 [Gemmatimonadales bacterium]
MAARFRLVPSLAIAGVVLAAGATSPASPRTAALPQQVPSGFTHGDHETLACFTCHENTGGHGALTVTTIEDCRSCHHAPNRAVPCSGCHEGAPSERFEVTRSVEFSVPSHDPRRSLAFPHDRHADLDCSRCHTQGTALAVPADLDCASCHEDHHTVESDCAACHAPVHVSAHPPAEVHVTCSGGACHQDVPFESVPRTRAFCLGCHRDKTLHEAPTDCATCHILPAPRGSR